jgi:hypothetical protein
MHHLYEVVLRKGTFRPKVIDLDELQGRGDRYI